ncbi:hypothetical protein CU103_22685 [Phyllobacterium sophorae]|uniref:Uncharacterized protein n=1 Tax=Phyllobacterium sophorae TaxID=1520277 RepID=A0A2P7B567_9HYPH|nr:hypothetical protein CU103_22685 [Phyllobacterium sophorae]
MHAATKFQDHSLHTNMHLVGIRGKYVTVTNTASLRREVEIEMSKGVRMWFGYTLSEDGVWEAVCYRTNFGNPPLENSLRTEMVEVPADCIGADGEPIFAKLRDRFPLEVEE